MATGKDGDGEVTFQPMLRLTTWQSGACALTPQLVGSMHMAKGPAQYRGVMGSGLNDCPQLHVVHAHGALRHTHL